MLHVYICIYMCIRHIRCITSIYNLCVFMRVCVYLYTYKSYNIYIYIGTKYVGLSVDMFFCGTYVLCLFCSALILAQRS